LEKDGGILLASEHTKSEAPKAPVVYVGHNRLKADGGSMMTSNHISGKSATSQHLSLPISSGKFHFCSTACRDKFIEREKQVEKMGPVAFREGIIQLISKANPKIPVRDLMVMREEATGMFRNKRVLKHDVREKDTANVTIQEKNVKPPSKEFEALHGAANAENVITIEGFVLPTSMASIDELPDKSEQESEQMIEDEQSSQIDPSDESVQKSSLPIGAQKMDARQIFHGFSDSDEEDLEEQGSSREDYIGGSSRHFTTYQRLLMTLSRWTTDGTLKLLNRYNQQPKQVKSSTLLSKEKELNQFRKMYQDMDVNLDAPRDQEGKTSSELKKPTRKRKPRAPKTDSATKNESHQQQPQTHQPTEEEMEEVREEKRYSAHIALNSPNYQRYQGSLNNLKSALHSALKTLGIQHASVQYLSQQLDNLLSTMNHDLAAECANDREWEIMCLVLILSLFMAGVLNLDERDRVLIQKEKVAERVSQLGMPSYHFDTLVESVSKGF